MYLIPTSFKATLAVFAILAAAMIYTADACPSTRTGLNGMYDGMDMLKALVLNDVSRSVNVESFMLAFFTMFLHH